MNREAVKAHVQSILDGIDLGNLEPGWFDGAYVRRGWTTTLVFLTVDLGESRMEMADMKALVERARLWCKEHVRATWVMRESGLNLVLFHDGQISKDLVVRLPDATGMHSAILQSVTAVDCQRSNVMQARTWIIIGTLRRALRRLRRIGDRTMYPAGAEDGRVVEARIRAGSFDEPSPGRCRRTGLGSSGDRQNR